jgi:hypothetical protein
MRRDDDTAASMIEEQDDKVLLEEGGIRITAQTVTTPAGEFPLAEIRGIERKLHKPVWGPFLLAVLGTLNLVAAVQTGFWGDWLAALVMLGGGLYWRRAGTRHVLVLEAGGKKRDAFYARDRALRDKAARTLEDALG